MSEPGAVFYRGPSLITGEPVVGIVTGLDGGSLNPKTGNLLQTWVIRPDLPPMEAVRRNLDEAICGDCSLRGRDGYDRKCYVTPFFAPNNVYKQFHAGGYIEASWSELQALIEGRGLRICAYGDPCALPFELWRTLLVTASTWVGYTHSWKTCDPRFKAIAMASVETEDERVRAALRGWRTFRIRMPDGPVREGIEFVCPASDEAGHRTTCARCQLCRGTSSQARSVVIVAHGKPSSLKAFGIHTPMFVRREVAV